MSATEGLKELEQRWVDGMLAERYDAGESLIDVLPQILALVQAAESFALRVEEDHQNERTYAIDDALTALKEALK